MNRFVLDASVALAWFIDRPVDAYAISVRRRLAEGWTAVAPSLWLLEVVNGLVVAERRKLLAAGEVDQAGAYLQRLVPSKILIDATFPALGDALTSARQFGLTAYDTLYLDLARNGNMPLASLDKALRAASVKAGVQLLQ